MDRRSAGTSRNGRRVIQEAFHPSRIKAIAVTVAVFATFTVQPPTPAQAAELWAHRAESQSSRTLTAPTGPGVDPAYEPPAKHGVNYVAPTAKVKPAAPGSSTGSEK